MSDEREDGRRREGGRRARVILARDRAPEGTIDSQLAEVLLDASLAEAVEAGRDHLDLLQGAPADGASRVRPDGSELHGHPRGDLAGVGGVNCGRKMGEKNSANADERERPLHGVFLRHVDPVRTGVCLVIYQLNVIWSHRKSCRFFVSGSSSREDRGAA